LHNELVHKIDKTDNIKTIKEEYFKEKNHMLYKHYTGESTSSFSILAENPKWPTLTDIIAWAKLWIMN